MNKWLKRLVLGGAAALAILILILMFPMALVSLGTGVVTMFLYLIVIGILIFKKNKSYVWIGAVVLMFLYLHTFTAPAVTGRIVDKTTKKPIENAIVHAEYYLSFPTIGGRVGYPVGEGLAVTDADGVYKLKPKVSIGTCAHRYDGIFVSILRPFTSFFDMYDPKVDVKVLHPLWEAKEKWIPLPNSGYLWMIVKFGKTMRHDEGLLSLGEKYRDGRIVKSKSGMYDSFNNELSEMRDYPFYADRLNLKINKLEIRNRWAGISRKYSEHVNVDWILDVRKEQNE